MSAIAAPEVTRSAALRVCVVVLGGVVVGVDVGVARGVVVFEDVTPVPGTPAHVIGAANLRGRVVPLVDARRALGLGPGPRGDRALVIEHDGIEVAVAIDEVVGIETFEQVLEPDTEDRGRLGGCVVGRLPHVGGNVALLSAHRLIAALREADA
jgi:chemotaxis signal transduction protein